MNPIEALAGVLAVLVLLSLFAALICTYWPGPSESDEVVVSEGAATTKPVVVDRTLRGAENDGYEAS